METFFKYGAEIDVPMPKEKLMSRVSNPLFFAGVTGHILVLKAHSREAEDFVPLSKLGLPSDKFRVVYAYGLCDEGIHLFHGYLEKESETHVGVMYKGKTDDGKVSWETVVELVPLNTEETRLQVSVMVHREVPRIAGFTGVGKVDVPKFVEHVVKDHVEPTFKLYFSEPETRSLSVEVSLVRSFEGPLNEVIIKAWEYIEDLGFGIIKVEGKEIKGTLVVRDGKIKETRVIYKGKALKVDEAIAKIMEESSPVKVSMYAVDTESLIGALISRAVGSR